MSEIPRSSGTYSFRRSFGDLIIDCFERIQIPPTVIDDPMYVIGAIRSANLIMEDDGANRGLNLWAVGDEQLAVPMVPGKAEYLLPDNVVHIFDSVIRTYTPGNTFRDVGFSPAFAKDEHGAAMLEATGEPTIVAPGSEVFFTQEGSPYVTMRWPGHGLQPGSPIFFRTPVTAGAMTLRNFVVVARVIDADSVTFVLPEPARVTRHGCGGTAIFVTHANQRHVTVVLSHHGYTIGNVFSIVVPVDVGGIRLFGDYSVVSTIGLHRFQIPTLPGPHFPDTKEIILSEGSEPQGIDAGGRVLDPGFDGPRARFTDSAYENGGVIVATTQAAGLQWTDVVLWPISRNDYNALPNKQSTGRPSVYWFDRAIQKKLFLWAAPAAGNHWAFVAFRQRYLEDADVTTQLDMPRRFWPAFTAQLTAALAEKYAPQQYQMKLQLAEMAWQRAADADRELVGTFLVPTLQPYFRGGY